MRLKRRPLLLLLFPFLLVSNIYSANANTPLAWQPSVIPPIQQDEMQAIFGTQNFSPNSNLNWSLKISPTELGKSLIFNKPWFYFALPPCSASITMGCIEGVEYRVNSQTWLKAELSSRQLPNRSGEVSPSGRNASGVISTQEIGTWPADASKRTPAGGTASYWKFPQAPHGGGDEYLLRANIAGLDSSDPSWVDGKVQRYLEMGLFPVDGLTEYQFPQDISVKVRLRLGQVIRDLWGWFDGRITNPDVLLDIDSDTGILEISGEPSRTPMGLTPKKKISDLPNEITSIFACPAGLPPEMCPPKGGYKWFATDGNAELKYFELFERNLGVAQTIGYKTEWWIKTTRSPEVANAGGCPLNQYGFKGIVTTNASLYSPTPPIWNDNDKTFEFQVASPHLAQDGTLNKGLYALAIPRQLAECRWTKDISKAKVTLSIINESGTNSIGVASFKLKDNLLIFNVSGFTYSTPKIKIGLAPQTSQTTSQGQAKATSTSSKTKVLVCQKGKVVKKVSGTNPQCPKGYVIKK